MAETNIQKLCSRECQKCSMTQQLYCSTSLAFMSYELVNKALERLERIENNMQVLQGSETELIKPQMLCGGDNRQAIETTTLNE